MTRTNKRKQEWPREVTVGRVTVKVYRDKLPSGNHRYRVDNRRLTGRFESYTVEAEALEAAERLAGRIETGETKAAGMTDKQAMEYILASDAVKPFGLTVSDAISWLSQALPKVGYVHKLSEALNFYTTHHRRITNITVAEAVEKLLERKKNRSERHTKTLRSVLGRFAKAFDCNIGDITTPQIQSYLDKCEFEAERTYHNHWSKINQLFRYASKQDFCMTNHADKVERADLEDGEVGIYTAKEIQKLLSACTPEFLPCMAIGAFAGLRSAEIERISWTDIDWEHREFVLDKKITKTRYSRTVPIQDNLLAWLAPFKGSTGKVWKGSHDGYYDTQSEISKTAGIEWVHNGLRHSFGTYRHRVLGGDVTKVAAEMGNTRAMVEKHYKRIVKPTDATAWFAVVPEQAANIVTLATSA